MVKGIQNTSRVLGRWKYMLTE